MPARWRSFGGRVHGPEGVERRAERWSGPRSRVTAFRETGYVPPPVRAGSTMTVKRDQFRARHVPESRGVTSRPHGVGCLLFPPRAGYCTPPCRALFHPTPTNIVMRLLNGLKGRFSPSWSDQRSVLVVVEPDPSGTTNVSGLVFRLSVSVQFGVQIQCATAPIRAFTIEMRFGNTSFSQLGWTYPTGSGPCGCLPCRLGDRFPNSALLLDLYIFSLFLC